MSPRARRARLVALCGYFGLWVLIPAWYLALSPPEMIPPAVAAGLLLFPLLFPLPGILRGRPYTFAWNGFLAMIYFGHGVSEAWTVPEDRALALLEIALSQMMLWGGALYARFSNRDR
ncbi:MAG TPA: DUF2069 domain-containing protein [Thiotrichales bacterium]|nr:DUF2069 domain-containing protein [Thiotrichales bacterium]